MVATNVAVIGIDAGDEHGASAYNLDTCHSYANYSGASNHIPTRNDAVSPYSGPASAASGAWNAATSRITIDFVSSNYYIRLTSADYGATGWYGHADRFCSYYGIDYPHYSPPSTARLNTYAGYGPPDYSFAQQIFVHEIGHTLGLNHTNSGGNCNSMSIMQEGGQWYPWLTCGFAVPRDDDVLGILNTYPK